MLGLLLYVDTVHNHIASITLAFGYFHIITMPHRFTIANNTRRAFVEDTNILFIFIKTALLF